MYGFYSEAAYSSIDLTYVAYKNMKASFFSGLGKYSVSGFSLLSTVQIRITLH